MPLMRHQLSRLCVKKCFVHSLMCPLCVKKCFVHSLMCKYDFVQNIVLHATFFYPKMFVSLPDRIYIFLCYCAFI
jgi:hypothetical protein